MRRRERGRPASAQSAAARPAAVKTPASTATGRPTSRSVAPVTGPSAASLTPRRRVARSAAPISFTKQRTVELDVKVM